MAYVCSKCAAEAVMKNHSLVPTCKCKAPIIANMTAKAKGAGGLKQG